MPVLGITGGIATGKSTFARALLQYLPAELFDA
jgi:dephospho-CoA kinase